MIVYITRPDTYSFVSRGITKFKFWLTKPTPDPIMIEDGFEDLKYADRDKSDFFGVIRHKEYHSWVSSEPPLSYKQFKLIVGDDFDFDKIWQMVSNLYDVEDTGDGNWLRYVEAEYDKLFASVYDVNEAGHELLARRIKHKLMVEEYVESKLTPNSTYMNWVGIIKLDIKVNPLDNF